MNKLTAFTPESTQRLFNSTFAQSNCKYNIRLADKNCNLCGINHKLEEVKIRGSQSLSCLNKNCKCKVHVCIQRIPNWVTRTTKRKAMMKKKAIWQTTSVPGLGMQTVCLWQIIKAGVDFDSINHLSVSWCDQSEGGGVDQDSIQKRMSPCSAFIFREKEEIGEIKRQLKRYCNLKSKTKTKK